MREREWEGEYLWIREWVLVSVDVKRKCICVRWFMGIWEWERTCGWLCVSVYECGYVECVRVHWFVWVHCVRMCKSNIGLCLCHHKLLCLFKCKTDTTNARLCKKKKEKCIIPVFLMPLGLGFLPSNDSVTCIFEK